MMLVDQSILTVHILFVLTFLWLIIFVLRRRYCEDKFRDELFTLRDELFDYAAGGNIEFDHHAYTLLRTRMNGMIRYAHRASLMQIFVRSFLISKTANAAVEEYRERWQSAVSQVERADIRLKLNDYQRRMGVLLARHLVRSSIILFAPAHLVVLIGMLISVATIEIWGWISKRVPAIEYLEVEAERAGIASA